MKSAQVCLLSLGCVGGAFAFGLVANAAIDLLMPMPQKGAAVNVSVAKPAEEPQPAPAYALASTTSTPVDFAPVKVKTIPINLCEERAEPAAAPQRIGRRAAAASAPGLRAHHAGERRACLSAGLARDRRSDPQARGHMMVRCSAPPASSA